MEFLAILIAVGLLQLWGSGAALHHDAWFGTLRGWLGGHLEGTAGRLAVILIPPVGIVLLQSLVHGRLLGILELVLLAAVLLYSFGRGDLAGSVNAYLERWSRGDLQAAFEQLRTEGLCADEEELIVDPRALHACAKRHLYHAGHDRLFAVLFWFMLAGPAAALVYRLARFDRQFESSESPAPLRLLHWLDWIPCRLEAVGFALLGHFDACMDALRPMATQADADATDLLTRCGDAALSFADLAEDAASWEETMRAGVSQIQSIETLQQRSLVLWIVIIAVIAISY